MLGSSLRGACLPHPPAGHPAYALAECPKVLEAPPQGAGIGDGKARASSSRSIDSAAHRLIFFAPSRFIFARYWVWSSP